MKQLAKWAMLLLAMLGCLCSVALANSAEPPGFTVIAQNAPEDLQLDIRVESRKAQVALGGWQRMWEKYWNFHYHLIPGSREALDTDGAVLVAYCGEEVKEMPIPAEALKGYSHVLMLDWENGTLQLGQSPWRIPLLVALRVGLTLLLEGVVLYLFGYRAKKSWLVFLITNLITQSFVNAMITGPQIGAYWMIGYVVMEILVFGAEMIVFGAALKEKSRGKAVLCALAANAASLLLGGLLLHYLPV